MKVEARNKLIKDILLAVVSWGIFSILLYKEAGIAALLIALVFAGLPFGWRWMSKVFIAISPISIMVKLMLSIFLGCIAIFVVIIGDIIAYVQAE